MVDFSLSSCALLDLWELTEDTLECYQHMLLLAFWSLYCASFFALGGMFMMSSNGYEYEYSSSSAEFIVASSSDYNDLSSSSVSSSSDIISPERPTQKLRKFVASLMGAAGSQSSSSESSENIQSSDSTVASEGSNSHTWVGSDSFSYDSYSFEDENLTGIIFLSVVVMIIGFFLAYLKVYSLVLAWKLRKMIITERLTPLPSTTKDSQVHEFAPSNTSCAVEVETPTTPAAPVAPFQPVNMMNMGAPMFAPGFAPYPYMMVPPQQGQQQFQYPHHMMFGQQPVFYTYAPSEQPAEKL